MLPLSLICLFLLALVSKVQMSPETYSLFLIHAANLKICRINVGEESYNKAKDKILVKN